MSWDKEWKKEDDDKVCKIYIKDSYVFIFCNEFEIEKVKECVKTVFDGREYRDGKDGRY